MDEVNPALLTNWKVQNMLKVYFINVLDFLLWTRAPCSGSWNNPSLLTNWFYDFSFFLLLKTYIWILKIETMKSKLIFYSLLTLSIIFLSCKKEETETEAEAVTTGTDQQPIIVPNVQPVPTQNNINSNQQQVTMPQQNTPQMVNQAPVATKAGMNPPHGQAGHRCDIAVGAPLNSPVAKAVTPPATTGKPSFTTTTTSTPNTTSTAPTTGTPELLKTDTPVATAPGMNPPHGQEGHDCAVAVGAPLPKK